MISTRVESDVIHIYSTILLMKIFPSKELSIITDKWDKYFNF